MAKTFQKKGLAKKSENISEWYHDVVLRAGLAEYSDVRGCMIIKPHGYALWETVQRTLDAWFKEDSVQNVYFPMFIPMSLMEKEKEHVKGFSPELAVVTHAGGEELSEPLALRPTSETVMYKTFGDWIQSWRDLPLKINQWCNVVRWEKRTYPFLRTSEFLWQEGHTAHRDEKDAMAMVLKALKWYEDFYREYFAIELYTGIKSANEKFAGAEKTFAVEIVVPDGKALQAATSHLLGDHFSKVFDVQYLDENGEKQYVQQTSWGLSTRSIGGLVLVHGDDSGLILPPRIAPQQVVIIAVNSKDEKKQKSNVDFAGQVADDLVGAGVRVVIDSHFEHSLGYRINEWELKGIPLRLEIGSSEVESKTVTFVRRDTLEKDKFNINDACTLVPKVLGDIQNLLLKRSKDIRNDLTVDVKSYEEFKKKMSERKTFLRAFWCENSKCEERIKDDTTATSRVLELNRMDKKEKGTCIVCNKPAEHKWLFAQAY